MGVTRYYTVNDRIVGENGPNGRIDYQVDALGSVVGTMNSSGSEQKVYRYKPFGAVLNDSGPGAEPLYRWVGAGGYRATSLVHSDYYVRARHYGSIESTWSSVDLLWPTNWPYQYASRNPASISDPSGLISTGSGTTSSKICQCCPVFVKFSCQKCTNDPNKYKQYQTCKPPIYLHAGYDSFGFNITISVACTLSPNPPDPLKAGCLTAANEAITYDQNGTKSYINNPVPWASSTAGLAITSCITAAESSDNGCTKSFICTGIDPLQQYTVAAGGGGSAAFPYSATDQLTVYAYGMNGDVCGKPVSASITVTLGWSTLSTVVPDTWQATLGNGNPCS